MSRLPVITALGGINPAGRLSGHHAYRRMVIDALSTAEADATWASLATLMTASGDPADPATREWLRDHTLIRRIERFDPAAIPQHRVMRTGVIADQPIRFEVPRRDLPNTPPPDWRIEEVGGGRVRVEIHKDTQLLVPETRVSKVTSAGELPSGFDPGASYPSRNHPRGLQLTVWAAFDALGDLGLPWEQVRAAVAPDQVAVFGSSAMCQLDPPGYGGMMQASLLGKRVTSKQLPLGLPQMIADFINAYVIGNVGTTGANIGACATFLYNLRQGVDDIRSGRRRVALIACSEAPVEPTVIEGYRTMGALAEDDALNAIDQHDGPVDNRRASRPFAENCGFTLAEGAVCAVLMDDDLALQLGARILGSVADVHIHADGYKKSIPGPGVGNYLTMARALATGRAILGEDGLRRTYVHAHGTSTPQNRVTESRILSELAGVFGLDPWTVAAIKAYVGHTLSPASGDQLSAALGSFVHGIIPGIRTVDAIADDVHQQHLNFPLDHVHVGAGHLHGAFINSKGFGGNNATALVLSPEQTERMLTAKHGKAAMAGWRQRNESVAAAAERHDSDQTRALQPAIYRFGKDVITDEALTITADAVHIPGFDQPFNLRLAHPYPDMAPDADPDGDN